MVKLAGDDVAHVGQPDAGALEFLGAVQALEHAEKFVGIAHVEADAVVLDEEDPPPGYFPASDFDPGRFAPAGEL